MPSRRVDEPHNQPNRRRPATTPEARENQMVALAVDLAERQLIEGTASAQVISHFLKLGSSREKLEQERLAHENELTKAKIENLAAAGRIEALYADAISAMRQYSGSEPQATDDDFED